MYSQPSGNASGSLLSGLAKRSSPYGKGLAMQAEAGLGMDRAQKQQELSLRQTQDDSQNRQQQGQASAQKAGNEAQERVSQGSLHNRAGVFEQGMGWDYANMARRRQLGYQQMLLNGLARDF
jgi:hypothetical protein